MWKNRVWLNAVLITALVFLCKCAAAADRQPNFLIFLSDDVGYGEYGFQGATDIPTPNIDSIAANGLRFTQAYVSGPVCSPTRAGLVTGRYQTRFGHEFNSAAKQSGLSPQETTIAARLQAAGYATAVIGKWHLGRNMENRPTKRGFDEFFGTLANSPYFHPTNFVDSLISIDERVIDDDAFYTTEEYAKRCVNWLHSHHNKPWLLYVPFNAQHGPLQAPKIYLDRFPGIADDRRRLFAAMMSAMDDAVGKVLTKVRDLGQEGNTLIFFLSDNGGPTPKTTSRNGPLRGVKGTTWEGGIRIPFCCQWKGTLAPGKDYQNPIIQLDIYPTCLAAAGIPIDPNWNLDGVDLVPYLTGTTSGKPHDTLYWRYGPQWAVRHANMKLVVARDGGPTPELYDVVADMGETKNLASDRPEEVMKLRTLWDRWNAEQLPTAFSP